MKRHRYLLQQEESQDDGLINLTPLIDVVFVILISFILLAPMLEMEKVSLAEGPPGKPSLTSSGVAVILTETNSILLNRKKITLSELPEQLRQLKKTYPKEPLRFFPDKRSQFGVYQEIKNIAEAVGFEEMDIILTPSSRR